MGLPYQPSRTAATMASQARVTREAAMRTREVAMRSAATSAMVEQVAGHGGAGGHASAPVMVQNLTNLCLSSSGKGGKEDREGDAVQLRVEGETRVHADAESAPSTSSSDGPVLCWEKAHGAKWQYFGGRDAQAGRKWIDVVDMQPQHNILADAVAFVRSYVVPEGYPESVAPAYTPYMQWRAIQHFFGGAMSVFTTRSLLHALGVSRAGSASSAVAVNWVIKDGAGRIGKMLFARHGKKFDCDLKQLRFAGDLLMELGAGVELATMAFPALFLPLACAANVAKNVAAVTSTSTRAPIYKAFAQRENIGDVTAKGECISNIADLLGAGLGIFLSKQNPPLAATFMALSCGYLMGSYKEVKAVMLPTLNRARFGVAVHSFLDSGKVPSLLEANDKEYIVKGPWAQEKPLELGARIYNAFSSRHEFSSFQSLFEKEQYMINYHPVKRRAYVILKDTATSDDVLRAAFHGHVLLHMLRQTRLQDSKKNPSLGLASTKALSMPSQQLMRESTDVKALIVDSFRSVGELYENFKIDAKAQGWVMGDSLLNPGDARMCVKTS